MKVVLTGVMCGPNGNGFRGTVLDIGKDETETIQDADGQDKKVPKADYLIANKYARPFDPVADKKAKPLVRADR